jgi:hypothetical protein
MEAEMTEKANSPGENEGRGKGRGKGDDKKVDLIVLISGVEVPIKAKPDDLLRDVVEKALKTSENVGQPIENWDLRDESGNVLDLDRTVGSYDLADGALLSLTLKAGVAG